MPILLPHEVYEHGTARLSPGARVHDRYEVICLLGHGATGAVYKATDTQGHRTVALKQILAVSDAPGQSFEREAQLLIGLRHPSLPAVSDCFGELGAHFLVMQFVPGDDLAATLRQRKKSFPLHDVMHWSRQLLDVLGYLHGRQPAVTHGDIKPSNLKPGDGGEIMLLDFALWDLRAPQPWPITSGTAAENVSRYSAPEQIEGRAVDARSDIYSLGATLYHLLTGALPPSALQRATSCRAGEADPLRSPDVLNPGIPRAVSRTIVRAMALDADDRFASAHEMRRSLDASDTEDRERDPAVDDALSVPRRVDVAVPSWVSTGQAFDLVVQVRFFESPRLGREDWPVQLRDTRVKESDQLGLVFRSQSDRAVLGPALLCVKVVAEDVVFEEGPEQLIEVPTDDYSARARLRMQATKTGLCHLEVKLCTENGASLGSIPVDVRVGGELARPPLRLGHLVLTVER